ncbi:helix-turn-helix domain-containing protein [Pseudoflavonifractor sp. 524-17]|uniref:helix-turn-helix domain-containing protein n=1 Tax=Pseudoflavonifractor sp. 524-17 TaxID=2304577 RepID=UPI0013794040|nr:helix-turn-helix domain-containing protein [Pseudoflavonifractor sp. 524-17]NCE64962.1 helix-turn-helix domain-containing protein [Pseudoflavonifractor sp. 524-17]
MTMTALLDREKFNKGVEMTKLNQEAFAEQVGLSDRHVRNLKKQDIDVSISVLYRISQRLDTPMEDLLVVQNRVRKAGA